METAVIIVLSVIALVLAAATALLWAQRSVARAESVRLGGALDEAISAGNDATGRADELREHLNASERENATLRERIDADKRSREEYQRSFERQLVDQRETFRAMFGDEAAKVLAKSTDAFLKRAGEQFDEKSKSVGEMVRPIAETLRKTDEKLTQIEKERAESFGHLGRHLREVREVNEQLRRETNSLVNALRKPQVRGRYGEMQLRRVAEISGMRDYCDFSEQTSARDADGNLLRPDMVVSLPNNRVIVVDAKTNIEAYLDATQATTPEDEAHHLQRFARHVADQAAALANKKYWKDWDGSPEFVVMFIPGDQFIDAALQQRPDLFEQIAQRGVILASPSTLIGLLRAVHVGWREKKLSDDAQELFALGKELHDRAATVFEHASKVGSSLDAANKAFNRLAGSLQSRMLPTLRRFEDAGAKSSKEIAEIKPIETTPREIDSMPKPGDERLLIE